MAHETIDQCSYETDRLVVAPWHQLATSSGLDLVDVVANTLSPTTTAALPPAWRGDFDRSRAQRWITERDRESPTSLAVERETGASIGLIILFEDQADDLGRIDVRLGYVLAEASWGQGFASELVAGLVSWAQAGAAIGSLSGGVADENAASARVLRKNGFEPAERNDGEQIFRLALAAR